MVLRLLVRGDIKTGKVRTMNGRAHWVTALLGSVIFGASMSFVGGWAHEPPTDGGPYISNPGAISPEEAKRQEQIHEDYCRSQPGGICETDRTFTPEQLKEMEGSKRDRGPYVPPDPRNTARW